ncbi:MAG: hypothetical protein PF904_02430 [Kiritimatiellae bacterium]|nr:hypothetical protein [Kiritimatiellia bacterium]
MQLLKDMQLAVKQGISALDFSALAELFSSVLSLQCSEGGFCGLDGKSDLYYSYFAVFMLEAHGSEYDVDLLMQWVCREFPKSHGVDRICAELLLLRSGKRSKSAARLSLLKSLLRIGPADSYKLFLTSLLMEQLLPEGINRFLLKRAAVSTLKRRASDDFSSLSTPVAVVCLLLASESGDAVALERMQTLLTQRHRSSGGYSSAPGISADLLSTSVVLFAYSLCEISITVDKNDRAFIELCWQDDGLFSSAPGQVDGDLEHTFYALLALGSI